MCVCVYIYMYIFKVMLQKYLHVFIVTRMANMSCTLPPFSLRHLMLRHPRQFITYISTHTFLFSFIITKYQLKYKVNTKCQKYVCLHFEIAAERNIKRALPLFFSHRFRA